MRKILALIFLTALVSGCVQQSITPGPTPGPTPVPNPGVKEFSVVIGHTFYNPPKLTVDKGDQVIIRAVAATGTAPHNHGITIDEYGINVAVTSEDPNNPVEIKFVADKTGTFSIWCKTCWNGPFGKSHPDIRGTLEVK